MYRLIQPPLSSPMYVLDTVTGANIPFDPANTDYQNFKIQVADGTPLEDPEGVLMTQQQVDDFLKTIP